MLFSRKTQLPQLTHHDFVLEGKYDEFLDTMYQLIKTVEDVIIKKGVIALYPDGSDKKIAVFALEQAQHTMICTIGHYDSIRTDLREYYQEHEGDFYKDWSVIYSLKTSHTVIEETYADFFKK